MWPTKRDEFGCELFTGKLDRDGYGRVDGLAAHRVRWAIEVGHIPPGMELDHACRRRNCVALHHLVLVTRSENERRKSWRYRARIATCPRGHDLKVHGVITPTGGKVCRHCNRTAT